VKELCNNQASALARSGPPLSRLFTRSWPPAPPMGHRASPEIRSSHPSTSVQASAAFESVGFARRQVDAARRNFLEDLVAADREISFSAYLESPVDVGALLDDLERELAFGSVPPEEGTSIRRLTLLESEIVRLREVSPMKITSKGPISTFDQYANPNPI
jgi:hypothetical protein